MTTCSDLNDFDRDPTNTFPDETVFLEYMAANGHDNGRLMIPGTAIELDAWRVRRRPRPARGRGRPPSSPTSAPTWRPTKRGSSPGLTPTRRRGRAGRWTSSPSLKEWFEPLIEARRSHRGGHQRARAARLRHRSRRARLPAARGLRLAGRGVGLPPAGQSGADRVGASCATRRTGSTSYSSRAASRPSARAPTTSTSTTSSSASRWSGWSTPRATTPSRSHEQQFFEAEGYRIQRRCPHLRADLTRFGDIEDGILTCTLHGWQFELATGPCLTSDDRKIFAMRLNDDGSVERGGQGGSLPASADLRAYRDDSRLIRDRCGHCWYDSKRKL